MGKIENKKELIYSEPCANMAEGVIAFATGSIDNKERRMEVLIHILTCQACNSLYEDILEYENTVDEAADVKESIFETIKVKLKENFILPLQGLQMENFSAAVLNNAPSKTAEFKFNSSAGEITAILMAKENKIDLEINTEKNLKQIYLLGNNKCIKQHPYEKQTVFENIAPGNYALSTELKDFVFLEIESDKE